MKIFKIFFSLTILFNLSSIFSTQLTISQITSKGMPNFDNVTKFFHENTIFLFYLKNLNPSQQKSWLGHKEDLIQELFEGLVSINQLAQNNNQSGINLAGATLTQLFGTSWQEFYKQ